MIPKNAYAIIVLPSMVGMLQQKETVIYPKRKVRNDSLLSGRDREEYITDYYDLQCYINCELNMKIGTFVVCKVIDVLSITCESIHKPHLESHAGYSS